MKAHELTTREIEGHHPLCDLAKEAGHASLWSYLNDRDAWGDEIEKIEADLKDEIEEAKSAE